MCCTARFVSRRVAVPASLEFVLLQMVLVPEPTFIRLIVGKQLVV